MRSHIEVMMSIFARPPLPTSVFSRTPVEQFYLMNYARTMLTPTMPSRGRVVTVCWSREVL